MNKIGDAGIQGELDAPLFVTPEQIKFYEENGYIKLKNVLSAQVLDHYRRAITERVAELSADALPMEQRDTYGKAFLQIMNLWTESDAVREFVFGKRLANIASQLMRVSGVRLYHDQALYKEPGGGITPWHADQYYWPVSSDKVIPPGCRCRTRPSRWVRWLSAKRVIVSKSDAISRSVTRAR